MSEETVAQPEPVRAKSRHGCLTAWLVLMLVANSASALMYIFGAENIRRNMPAVPQWAFPVLIVFSLFNLACAIALFRWKKWGFWGFCASGIIALVINLYIGINPVTALSGLIGLALLFGVLQIGKENKGWPQLE